MVNYHVGDIRKATERCVSANTGINASDARTTGGNPIILH